MTNSNYQRGANFERKVKKWYESQGCFVIRSAGSHSPVDLVVLRYGQTVLVQCKTDGKLPEEEEMALRKVATGHNCIAHLAYKGKTGIEIKIIAMGYPEFEIQPWYPKEGHEEQPRT